MRVKKIKVKKQNDKFGLSSLFSKKEVFYQKNTGILNPTNLLFSPIEYEGVSNDEKSRAAFEDAKNHKKFYQELVDRGVYPAGTRVKVKRMRNSDKYSLELTMPKIKPLKKLHNTHEQEEVGKMVYETYVKIAETAKDFGYNYRRLEQTANGVRLNPEGFFNEDVDANRNYGYVGGGFKKPKVHYHDVHILHGKLPFEKRKYDPIENAILEGNKRAEVSMKKYSENKNLEQILGKVASVLLLVFGIGLNFNYSRLTGYSISNISKNFPISPMIFFLLGVFGMFFYFFARKS